jgi:hypothetical protein
MGFALVSADERVPEVLCYTEVGSISDTTFNKSLKFCLEILDMYMEEQTGEELDIFALANAAKAKIDSVNNELQLLNEEQGPITRPIVWTEVYTAERSKPVPVGWHQSHPFNNLLPFVNGVPPENASRAYVGCAMVAVSQIMAFHKKPFRNYISTADWANMINNPYTSSQLHSLMKNLFDDMVISYDHNGSSSNISKARSFLNNNGYSAGSESSYSFNTVWDALNDGPTYVRGSRLDGTNKMGHAWVGDGARRITTYEYVQTMYLIGDLLVEGPIELVSETLVYRVRFEWGRGIPGNYTWILSNSFLVDGLKYEHDVAMIRNIK